MLRRRHHPQKEAPRKAEGRQKTHASAGQRGSPPGSLHGRPQAGRIIFRLVPLSRFLSGQGFLFLLLRRPLPDHSLIGRSPLRLRRSKAGSACFRRLRRRGCALPLPHSPHQTTRCLPLTPRLPAGSLRSPPLSFLPKFPPHTA